MKRNILLPILFAAIPAIFIPTQTDPVNNGGTNSAGGYTFSKGSVSYLPTLAEGACLPEGGTTGIGGCTPNEEGGSSSGGGSSLAEGGLTSAGGKTQPVTKEKCSNPLAEGGSNTSGGKAVSKPSLTAPVAEGGQTTIGGKTFTEGAGASSVGSTVKDKKPVVRTEGSMVFVGGFILFEELTGVPIV